MRNERIEGKERLILCINASLQKKAKDLVVLNVKSLSSFADYFIICSGTSDRQVRAIASAIREYLKDFGILPLSIEGEKLGSWILLDYDDVIIHVFYEPVRGFYEIDRLWSDAKRLEIAEEETELVAIDSVV